MSNYILFDDALTRKRLLPLTFTRPVCDLRTGILTLREKWERQLNTKTSTLTEAYLATKYPLVEAAEGNIFINGATFPDADFVAAIEQLPQGVCLTQNDIVLAFKGSLADFKNPATPRQAVAFSVKYLTRPWQIFQWNGAEIERDFKTLTAGRQSQPLSATNHVFGNPEHIFLEEGAVVECSVLNLRDGGYIYVGKDAEIMENCVVRGSLALGEHAALKVGAKIYGPTTAGEHCKIGGEVGNSVFFGFTNKGHDGYVGNSVLGEWCNLGADTNTSNLKNNYAEVKLWDYDTERFINTGTQFCGLIMGDHSKCGINTMFNTGTVVGVSCNIFGTGYPRNFVPSFSWGGAAGFTDYKTAQAFEVAERVMVRRSIVFGEVDRNILTHIYESTKQFR